MSLENDLDKLEKMLGFEPQTSLKHPNPYKDYPSIFEGWSDVIKAKIKDILCKVKKMFKKEVRPSWGE